MIQYKDLKDFVAILRHPGSKIPSIILNVSNIIHDPNEIERLDYEKIKPIDADGNPLDDKTIRPDLFKK